MIFYEGEISKDAKAEEKEVNGIYSLRKFGIYSKDFLKGKKFYL